MLQATENRISFSLLLHRLISGPASRIMVVYLVLRLFLSSNYSPLTCSCSPSFSICAGISMALTIRQQAIYMDIRNNIGIANAVIFGLFFIPKALSQYHSPAADAATTIDVTSLFQHTTSRNQKVITQAVDIVISMQTAPTCTQMAASHLMNECRLLEHAPDFARVRPEAYLDNVKTEYAAKLAVCELLSAQPVNSAAPPHCDVLIPAARHCGKSGSWWHAQAVVSSDKQCYPTFKERQYIQCLKSLQSTPQYWTSFSNARQNAVVMCQASRDAIERENHLEVFKNLTQVLGGVITNMQKTNEEYESLIRQQRRHSEEVRDTHQQLNEELQAVRAKAVSTVEAMDSKFHTFMESSISDFITALGTSQSKEMDKIRERMQEFSQDLIVESSQLAKYFSDQLQQYHERTLANLQVNHEAQVHSYTVLSGYMATAQKTMNTTNDVADRSLSKVDSIAQRLDLFESQTEHIAEGFAFLSAIPALFRLIVRRFVATIGTAFIFAILCRLNTRLATYTAGACSSAFLLHTSGVFDWLAAIPSSITNMQSQSPLAILITMSSWNKGTGLVLLLWLAAYPVCRLNIYLGTLVTTAARRLLAHLWLSEYTNDGGTGYLPSIEVPAITQRKDEKHTSYRQLHN